MQIPKLDTPTYELKIPSSQDVIKFRPFLVKEEKILLMAQESGKEEEIAKATIDVINTCTFNKFDAGKIPVFDVEYILLQIRAKSVGEIVKLKLICQDDMKTVVETECDLTELEVLIEDGHTNKLIIDEKRNLGVVFGYPNYELASQGVDISGANLDKTFIGKDIDKAQMREFFESMNTQQFEKVQKFFETMPKIVREFELTNPNTGKKSSVILKGLNDFF